MMLFTHNGVLRSLGFTDAEYFYDAEGCEYFTERSVCKQSYVFQEDSSLATTTLADDSAMKPRLNSIIHQPSEILREILSYVVTCAADLANLCLVCRYLHCAAQDEQLWKRIYLRQLMASEYGPLQRSVTRVKLYTEVRDRKYAIRRSILLSPNGWQRCMKLSRVNCNAINFSGFYTDGGHTPGGGPLERCWAGVVFRPDNRNFYCSAKASNVFLCGILSFTTHEQTIMQHNESLNKENSIEREENRRFAALSACLQGFFPSLPGHSSRLDASVTTYELEKMFLRIMQSSSGVQSLLAMKQQKCALPDSEQQSVGKYRQGLYMLQRKLSKRLELEDRKARNPTNKTSMKGTKMVFQDAFHSNHAQDREYPEVVRPVTFLSRSRVQSYAILHRLVIDRTMDLASPVRCAAVFLGCDVIKLETASRVPEGQDAADSLAREIQELKAAAMVSAFTDLTSLAQVQHFSSQGVLPPIEEIQTLQDSACIIIFERPEPKQLDAALYPAAWFCLPRGSAIQRLELQFEEPRVARLLCVKLIAADHRAPQLEATMDCAGVYAYGNIMETN